MNAELKSIVCRNEKGQVIPMREKIATDGYYTPHSRAATGKYWKYNCSLLEAWFNRSCWFGDTGHGRACNVFDVYIFRTKCYDSLAAHLTATAAGVAALIFTTM